MHNIAEITINYQPTRTFSESETINQSSHAYKIFIQQWDFLTYRESFKVLLLNRAHKVLGVANIGTGGTAAVYVDTKLIFQAALKANASCLILAHNHPSGNINPSTNDMHATKKLIEAGKILDIDVLDHLIITENGFYSFGDQGLI